MPKKPRELKALEVSRLTEPGHHVVGGVPGLALQVAPGGARTWVLRITVGSKRRDMGLGGYPGVTLEDAKTKARQARALVEKGIDPILQRRQAKSALAAQQAAQKTFKQCATAYIDGKSREWANAKHAAQWTSTLETYAYPTLGDLLVGDIGLPQVLGVLKPIWNDKTETASRVRGRIEAVLDWATVHGYREGLNPARWKGHLDKLLAARGKVAKVQHHKALPIDDVPAFLARLREQAGMGARALEFAILTLARSGEVRGATWAEIDLGRAEWTIPAERMKAGKEHRVPLSKPALELLQALPRMEGTDLVFPSTMLKPLSDMTLLAAMRRMKVDAVPHGFRSSFRDWASERTSYPHEVVEMALAHAIADKVVAAYLRGDVFEKRRRLMDDWAAFCGNVIKGGGMVPLERNRA
ncbi:integrase arm-type DNA-binding domain-containing protein [Ramlibacter sp. AW1]|uniref:Integrase arm-type DNA-binding domain-containing protein n=1 Tax=Ramlibacter aurantiacus TaxID=2801330 RepID=A0A936ZFD7_9BURK|nr:site-specific integrase [Ramlibacter aurantiacus]MBL0420504.1 integrase arm-type DNA-binding domain-containing protein [Ramlibacter aurantiacus]